MRDGPWPFEYSALPAQEVSPAVVKLELEQACACSLGVLAVSLPPVKMCRVKLTNAPIRADWEFGLFTALQRGIAGRQV
jgi:hypothetical protein